MFATDTRGGAHSATSFLRRFCKTPVPTAVWRPAVPFAHAWRRLHLALVSGKPLSPSAVSAVNADHFWEAGQFGGGCGEKRHPAHRICQIRHDDPHVRRVLPDRRRSAVHAAAETIVYAVRDRLRLILSSPVYYCRLPLNAPTQDTGLAPPASSGISCIQPVAHVPRKLSRLR